MNYPKSIYYDQKYVFNHWNNYLPSLTMLSHDGHCYILISYFLPLIYFLPFTIYYTDSFPLTAYLHTVPLCLWVKIQEEMGFVTLPNPSRLAAFPFYSWYSPKEENGSFKSLPPPPCSMILHLISSFIVHHYALSNSLLFLNRISFFFFFSFPHSLSLSFQHLSSSFPTRSLSTAPEPPKS